MSLFPAIAVAQVSMDELVWTDFIRSFRMFILESVDISSSENILLILVSFMVLGCFWGALKVSSYLVLSVYLVCCMGNSVFENISQRVENVETRVLKDTWETVKIYSPLTNLTPTPPQPTLHHGGRHTARVTAIFIRVTLADLG